MNLKLFNEYSDWKSLEKDGKLRKSIQSKLSLLGKRVKVGGEEGVIVISSFVGEDPEYFIMYSENDLEQLICSDFRIYDELKNKWVEDSNDINIFIELTDEEKRFLGLDDPEKVLKIIPKN